MKSRKKFKLSKISTSRLNTVSKYLQITTERALNCSPVDFSIPWMGGKRTPDEQNKLYRDGNSKCDGYINLSYHEITDSEGLAQALDIVPYINGFGISYEAMGRFGIIGMLMLEAWEELQKEGKIPTDKYLHWGGLWSHKNAIDLGWDSAHYEIRDYEQIEKV